MRGKIIKGIAGFYYVHTPAGLYECKAKGIFRKDGMKPLVGDDVEVEVLDQVLLTGNIIRILPRSNALIRPACANVDQSLVIFAIVKPEPNYNLLDRFLISMERQKLPAVICFNKKDLASEKEQKELCDAYSGCGYQVLFVSGIDGRGMEKIQSCLKGKTTVVAGPLSMLFILRQIWKPVRSAGRLSGAGTPRGMRSFLPCQTIPLSWIRRDLLPSPLGKWKKNS